LPFTYKSLLLERNRSAYDVFSNKAWIQHR